MQVEVTVYRFDPESGQAPRYQTYSLDDVAPGDRILDLLNRIKWEQDGTLTYRRSCLHGVCGSDAVLINGKNGLACQQLVKNYNGKTKFRVEPLPAFPVIKDLVVDMEGFYKNMDRIRPWFEASDPDPARERLQDESVREQIDEATRCILCGSCTGSCPSFWTNQDFLGPAALLKAYRFVYDDRDTSTDQRLEIINSGDGAWRCHTVLNCNAACPKEIDITNAISRLKRKTIEQHF